eukprot:TRINITY_DN4255_c1_g1_i1.p1 TRINITY_DN4255_c1_g1~~TRINITY_DN4255_c1_g1_i1.p1  ORF type:complete len:290 (+),score=83.95 TRINITY_DN4255_c1_g1_i1:80-949(+)
MKKAFSFRTAGIGVIIALLLGLALPALAQDNPAADKAARAWLGLLDQGKYATAWEQAAPLMQKHITKAQWEKRLKEAAAKLGPATERKLIRSQVLDNPPEAPKGKYLILFYAPMFVKSPITLEQVALRQDAQGKWQVVGYYLKQPRPPNVQREGPRHPARPFFFSIQTPNLRHSQAWLGKASGKRDPQAYMSIRRGGERRPQRSIAASGEADLYQLRTKAQAWSMSATSKYFSMSPSSGLPRIRLSSLTIGSSSLLSPTMAKWRMVFLNLRAQRLSSIKASSFTLLQGS